MLPLPCFELREALVQENMQEREEFVVIDGDDRVQFEQWIKIENVRQPESCCNGVYGCRLASF